MLVLFMGYTFEKRSNMEWEREEARPKDLPFYIDWPEEQ